MEGDLNPRQARAHDETRLVGHLTVEEHMEKEGGRTET